MATIFWPGDQLSITKGPVPSGLRLMSLPTLSTHSLGSTEVNGMVMAMRKSPWGFSSVISTVESSTTLKPLISLALPSMKSWAPTTPV